jgi:hypothetical protein
VHCFGAAQAPDATKATTDTFFLGVSPVITPEQIKYIETVVDRFFNEGI